MSNPTPYAEAYTPYNRTRSPYYHIQSDIPESNYTLEAAAALGHIEVVKTLLAQYVFMNIVESAVTRAFIVACRHGHQEIVEAFLDTMQYSNVPFYEASQEAASQGHVAIVPVLLAHIHGAQSKSACLEAALRSSIRGKTESFHEFLSMAQIELSKTEKNAIVSDCLPEAAASDQWDFGRTILSRDLNVDQQYLIVLMSAACRNGNLEVVASIATSTSLILSSGENLLGYVRLAVENGRTTVTRYLLPHFLKHAKKWHLHSMVLVAAGCGYVEILSLVLSGREDWGHEHDDQLLRQALNVAARNGHESTCALLLSKGVDPCISTSAISWDDVSSASPPDALTKEASSDPERWPASKEAPAKRRLYRRSNGPIHPPKTEFNALECCILEIMVIQSIDSRRYHSGWEIGTMTQRTSALRLLLQHTISLKGAIWDEAMYAAVKACDPSLISMMIEKGANFQARHESRSLLECAATRELLCLPVMQSLMHTGTFADIPKDELQHLLSTTFSQFLPYNDMYFFDMSAFSQIDGSVLSQTDGSVFSQTDTLQDLFTTGPGALAVSLLQLLPDEKISCATGSVFLQCAAAAGLIDFVKLAIDRQVDVNGTGWYYGTALQAAARFGHTSIVKLLLDAKANVNTRQGSHHTALRAAVLGGSLATVSLILEAGASTELVNHGSYPGDKGDSTPLQLAVQHNRVAIAQALVEDGAQIEVSRNEQQPRLIQACALGNISLVDSLLEAGADVQVRGHRSSYYRISCEDGSALHAAIESGNVDLIRVLLRKGFDLSADFGEFRSPLTLAARKGDPAILEVLIRWTPNLSKELLIEAFGASVKTPEMLFFNQRRGHDDRILERAYRGGEPTHDRSVPQHLTSS